MPTRAEALALLTASGPFELVEDASDGGPVRIYRNAPASLRDVLGATRQHGERPFLIYGDEVLTYADHFRRAAALAHRLRMAGVGPGDRVALGMRNYPEWSIAFFACQAIGAVVVALNAWWTTAELDFALQDSSPAALLLDGERLERLRDHAGRKDYKLVLVARRGGAGDGGEDFGDERADDLPDVRVGPNDLATILYTSGTTGRPKGAMATHRNHVTNIFNGMVNAAAGRLAAGLPDPAPDAPQAGMLQTFPFFHIGGLSGLYGGAAGGVKMALMYKWVPHEAVALVERHGLTAVAGVPIVVRQLLETAQASGAELSTLMGVTSGGAPVPPDLIRRIGDQFQSRASPGNGYGLTETTSAVIINSGPDYLASPASVGRPAPTASIRIVDDAGADAPQGAVGEIWVRGPNVIPGYWRNPEATEAAFGGGWFRTGDLGYVDADGLYYVVDRKKDVIIRGGENVYCAEVEAAILEQPGVRDAAVVGLPHPDYGEEVAAIVQVAPDDLTSATVDAIRARLGETLARFKLPTDLRLTDEDLPRTATGKILKADVRRRFFAKDH
jgi:long-chain acyl-CoA synthetase